MTSTPRYSLLQRLIHWAIAIIAIFMLAAGLTLGYFGFDGLKNNFGMDVTNFIYKYHKTFGVILLGLMTLRIIVKLILGSPEYEPPLPRFNKVASSAVHGMLYMALLVQPILGWFATSAGGFPVEFFNTNLPGPLAKDKELYDTLIGYHRLLGRTILVLVAVHIGAALMHAFVIRDTVMKRMSFF